MQLRVVAKARSGDVLPDRMVSEMILEAKFQRKKTQGHQEDWPRG